MALRADQLHFCLGGGVVGAAFGDGVGEVVGQALGRIVGDAHAVEAAHVAGGAGGDEHVARGEGVGRRVKIQQAFLGLEHDAVLGLLIDFDLRVVGTHVALGAGARQPSDAHGTGVARVAGGAGADGAVGIGPADAVALIAAAGHRRAAFELRERMRGTASAAGLISFREVYLLRAEAFFAVDGGPRGCGMPAVEKLLVDVFMAGAAVAGGELGGNGKAVVVFFLLIGGGLVAIEAVHTFLGVGANLVFVDDGVLSARVAFGALAGGAHEICAGLVAFDFGAGALNQECGDYEGKGH